MTYFEQAVRFLEDGKTEDAAKYFGYARDYGSEEEKACAEKILAQLKSLGKTDASSLAFSKTRTTPKPDGVPATLSETDESRVNAAFNSGYNPERREAKRPHIVLCGYTGTGKSSLAKAILSDIVPEDAIGTGRPQTRGFNKYENDDIVLFDSQGFEAGQTEEEFLKIVREFVRKKQENPNVDEHIHLVWYTISLPGARVTPCDLSLIKNIFGQRNTIVVLTKKDSARKSQIEAMRRELIEHGIEAKKIIETSDEEGGSLGCEELMELTAKMLPEAYRGAFISAQKINIEKKIEMVMAKKGKARTIVVAAGSAAAATGAIPIPGPDAPLIIAEQCAMIGGLSALYGFSGEQITKGALPFLAKIAGTTAASQLSKFIPIAGSVISAAVAGTITGAIGFYCTNVFEKMAIAKAKGEKVEFPDFSMDEFKYFYERYKEAKNNKSKQKKEDSGIPRLKSDGENDVFVS